MVRLVLVGPPGAGKGTQARTIASAFAIPHISTGDIFRANMRDATPLGREAGAYVERGELVPDDVVNRMVFDRLAQPDATSGFLLDGYPRTINQAETLDVALEDRGQRLNGVLHFVVDEDELERRIARRQQLEHRPDDDHETFVRRLEEYRKQTTDLIPHYESLGLLVDIDAVGTIEEVAARTLDACRKLAP